MTFAIRAGAQEDASAIAEVHIASWQRAYAHVVPRDVLYGDEFLQNRRSLWDAWRFHPGQRVAVSTDADAIVGFAAYGPERVRRPGHTGRGELYSFYFHPDVWGTGAASALLDHVDERLRAEGFDEAVLWVLEDNPRARAFYERHGWTASGITADFDAFCDLTLPEVEYRKHFGEGTR
jgi:ribosomal protein S18 acetylase RimI-like enzyme